MFPHSQRRSSVNVKGDNDEDEGKSENGYVYDAPVGGREEGGGGGC